MGGVAFYFPDEWIISGVKSSYQGKQDEDPTDLVAILMNSDDKVRWRSIVEIARDSISASKHSGGFGTIVIDLIYKNEKPQNSLNFAVEIGSKIKDGIKIVGTDSVENNIE